MLYVNVWSFVHHEINQLYTRQKSLHNKARMRYVF